MSTNLLLAARPIMGAMKDLQSILLSWQCNLHFHKIRCLLSSWNTLHIDQNSKTSFLQPRPLLYCDYNWVQQNHIPELLYSGEGSCRSIHHHLQAFPTNSTSKRRVEFGGIRHDPANLCPQLFLRLKETYLCKKTKILCSNMWTLTTYINLSQPPLTLCEYL